MLKLSLNQKTKLTDEDPLNGGAAGVIGTGFDDPNLIEETGFKDYDSGRKDDLDCGETLTLDPDFFIRFVMIETRNPVDITLVQPSFSRRNPDVAGKQAESLVTLVNNTFPPGAMLQLLGVNYIPGVQFDVGTTLAETVQNINESINGCVETAVSSKIVSQLGGPPNSLILKAKDEGVAGNSLTLGQVGTNFTLSGATFTGGVNRVDQFASNTVQLRQVNRLFIQFGLYTSIQITSVFDNNPIKWLLLGQKELVLE